MAARNLKRTKLSKHILEMKFMQRTKEKVEKQNEEEEGRAMFASDLTERMADEKSNYFVQPSFVVCEGLLPGRMSFLGMNPYIEKIMASKSSSSTDEVPVKEEADVSLNEMTETYVSNSSSTLVETVATKFQKGKRNKVHDQGPDKKKMKFSNT